MAGRITWRFKGLKQNLQQCLACRQHVTDVNDNHNPRAALVADHPSQASVFSAGMSRLAAHLWQHGNKLKQQACVEGPGPCLSQSESPHITPTCSLLQNRGQSTHKQTPHTNPSPWLKPRHFSILIKKKKITNLMGTPILKSLFKAVQARIWEPSRKAGESWHLMTCAKVCYFTKVLSSKSHSSLTSRTFSFYRHGNVL